MKLVSSLLKRHRKISLRSADTLCVPFFQNLSEVFHCFLDFGAFDDYQISPIQLPELRILVLRLPQARCLHNPVDNCGRTLIQILSYRFLKLRVVPGLSLPSRAASVRKVNR